MRWSTLGVLSVLGAGCLSGNDRGSDPVAANPQALHDEAEGNELLKFSWELTADEDSTFLGDSVASAGDVNGDGYDDVVIGAPWYSHGDNFEGRAFVFLGSAAGLKKAPAWTTEGNQKGAEYGDSVASAGDVNGDGYDDVIIGESRFDGEAEREGAAYVFLGSDVGLDTVPVWSADPTDLFQSNYGGSVSSAGDVNGDGYDDVIVGTSGFGNSEVSEGAALVYLGSASGTETTPAWKVQSNHESANFGYSVSAAGDVNGDGYDDVVVGAHGLDNPEIDEGGALLYLGSATGLGTKPTWQVESDELLFYFGVSVAGAGDVNGDGFDDVVVGWGGFGDEIDKGRATLYLGSASGLSTDAVWSVKSDLKHSNFGVWVASAGDIDADGYGDLVVGAPDTSDGNLFEGRIYVYLGSATGPATDAAWTREANRTRAHLGVSAASAGDVNGDGFGDLVAGAPGELLVDDPPSLGTAVLFLGRGDRP